MIGDVHGISERSASNYIHTVDNDICEQIDRFITWSDDQELTITKQEFFKYCWYPYIPASPLHPR